MDDKFYVLIAGGRDFTNYEVLKKTVNEELKDNKLPVTLISGAARGADSLGEKWAKEYGHEIVQYKPEWDTYGNSAGPIRNNEMFNFIKDKLNKKIIIFWDGQSRGTMYMIKISTIGQIPISIYNYNGELM